MEEKFKDTSKGWSGNICGGPYLIKALNLINKTKSNR